MLYHLFAFCKPITALAAKNPDASAVTPSCSLCDEAMSVSHCDIAQAVVLSTHTVMNLAVKSVVKDYVA